MKLLQLGATIVRTHMIESGQFPSSPSRPLRRSQLAHARATLGPFASLACGANAMRSFLAIKPILGLFISATRDGEACRSAHTLTGANDDMLTDA